MHSFENMGFNIVQWVLFRFIMYHVLPYENPVDLNSGVSVQPLLYCTASVDHVRNNLLMKWHEVQSWI